MSSAEWTGIICTQLPFRGLGVPLERLDAHCLQPGASDAAFSCKGRVLQRRGLAVALGVTSFKAFQDSTAGSAENKRSISGICEINSCHGQYYKAPLQFDWNNDRLRRLRSQSLPHGCTRPKARKIYMCLAVRQWPACCAGAVWQCVGISTIAFRHGCTSSAHDFLDCQD